MFVSLEKVWVSNHLGLNCAVLREALGTSPTLTMCIQGCFGDGSCQVMPPESSWVHLRGRLIYDDAFFAGPRWLLSGSTTKAPNPTFP